MPDQRSQPSAQQRLISYVSEHGPLCPECRYSLKGLTEPQICPECGCEIDYEWVAPDDVEAIVFTTITWCGLGAIGWIVAAYFWWLANTIRIPAPMFEERLNLREHLDDLAGTALISMFAVCLIVWRYRAISIIHCRAVKSETTRLRVPKRIIAVAIPGILLGTLCGLLLLMLLGS